MEERGQTQQGNDSSRFKYSGDDARAHRGDEVIGVRACDERYVAHNADAVNSSDDGGGADGVSLLSRCSEVMQCITTTRLVCRSLLSTFQNKMESRGFWGNSACGSFPS